jgi:hypothetical protein
MAAAAASQPLGAVTAAPAAEPQLAAEGAQALGDSELDSAVQKAKPVVSAVATQEGQVAYALPAATSAQAPGVVVREPPGQAAALAAQDAVAAQNPPPEPALKEAQVAQVEAKGGSATPSSALPAGAAYSSVCEAGLAAGAANTAAPVAANSM